jgi:hypothetical protein
MAGRADENGRTARVAATLRTRVRHGGVAGLGMGIIRVECSESGMLPELCVSCLHRVILEARLA